jgi:hypothetical protein
MGDGGVVPEDRQQPPHAVGALKRAREGKPLDVLVEDGGSVGQAPLGVVGVGASVQRQECRRYYGTPTF